MIRAIFLPIVLFVLLPSCESTKAEADKNDSNSQGARLEQRLKRWDSSSRSSFETNQKTFRTSKEFRTGKDYRTQAYKGQKDFRTKSSKLQESTFQGRNKRSRITDQEFRQSDRQASVGNEEFKTSNSRFQDQALRDRDKGIRDRNQNYRTFDNQAAQKGMDNSRRPYIQETQEPKYSESQIRSLLNKF